MKSKKFNFILILALTAFFCASIETFAQKKPKSIIVKPTRPGTAGGGVRGLVELPTTDEMTPEPEVSRGEGCCMDFVNNTGFFVDIWFDQQYQGRISPWQEKYSLCQLNDAKNFTAITVGKKLEWSGKVGCGGSAILKPE